MNCAACPMENGGDGCPCLRDERIEFYYDQDAHQLAMRVVALEDELAELQARIAGLEK